MERQTSDYAQPGLTSPSQPLPGAHAESAVADTSATASVANGQYAAASQAEIRSPTQYTSPSADGRPSATPQPDYGLSSPPQPSLQAPPPGAATAAAPAARPSYADYLARPSYVPHTQAAGPPAMAQPTSPSLPLPPDGQQNGHRHPANLKSDTDVPIDPSMATTSPTYPPPYSPYAAQPAHDLAQYAAHPPPQLYARPEWGPSYPQHPIPAPYGPATTVGLAPPPPALAGPRPGQVLSDLLLSFSPRDYIG